MASDIIFQVGNHHVANCGRPPHISGDDPSGYASYFENDSGEQLIFVCDGKSKKAHVYHGDAGWEHAYEVRNGNACDLILSSIERKWLSACWQACGAEDAS